MSRGARRGGVLRKLARRRLPALIALVAFVANPLFVPVAHAAHYDWDQGHDPFAILLALLKGFVDRYLPNIGASPVDSATGNLHLEFPDLVTTSALSELEFNVQRAYNSQDRRSGPFGRGWSFLYDVRLIEVAAPDDRAGDVILRPGDGRRERFHRRADGGYDGPPSGLLILTKSTAGFELTHALAGLTLRFDGGGFLLAMRDRNGQELTIERSGSCLAAVVDPAGRRLTFTQGPDGRIAAVTDPVGRQVLYSYSADGDLMTVTAPNGGVTRYEYDAGHRLTRIVDPVGGDIFVAVYDTRDRVVDYTLRGSRYTLTYAVGKTTKREAATGATFVTEFDADGRATVRTSSVGSRRYEYDAHDRMTAYTDRRGNRTVFSYESPGQGLSTGARNVAELPNDQLAPSAVTLPDGAVYRFTYDATSGLMTSVTNPDGSVMSWQRAANGRLLRVVDRLSNVTAFDYDAQGMLVAHRNSAGGVTRFEHDAMGLLSRWTDTLGSAHRMAYNGAGNLVRHDDQGDHPTVFAYDASGRLAAVTDALGATTAYAYDAAGQLATVTRPSGEVTTLSYNAAERLTKVAGPAGSPVDFTYNPDGSVATTSRCGRTTTYTYNTKGRLTRKVLLPANQSFNYAYDADGNLTQASGPTGTITFTYDKLRRVTSTATSGTTSQVGTTIRYTYDSLGRIATREDPSGTSTFTYDGFGLLARIDAPGGRTVAFQNDALGRMIGVSYPNGVSGNYSYDTESQLLGVQWSGPALDAVKFDYTYDADGLRTSVTDSQGVHAYTYDAAHRLTGATHDGADGENYAYDASGNQTADDVGARTIGAWDTTTATATETLSYDDCGNLIERVAEDGSRIVQYSYDGEDRLTRVRTIMSAGTLDVGYAYDALGRRIARQTTAGTTRYLLDGANVIAEFNASSVLTASHVHGPGVDQVIGTRRGATDTYYLTDALGTVRYLSDANGARNGEFTYATFGAPKASTAPRPSAYAFHGRELDESTGLYYFRARDYDPELGLFLQRNADAGLLEAPVSQHPYAFQGHNPVSYRDPDGNIAWFALAPVIIFGGGVISGGIKMFTSDGNPWKNFGKGFASGSVGTAIGLWNPVAGAFAGSVSDQALDQIDQFGFTLDNLNWGNAAARTVFDTAFGWVVGKGVGMIPILRVGPGRPPSLWKPRSSFSELGTNSWKMITREYLGGAISGIGGAVITPFLRWLAGVGQWFSDNTKEKF